MKPHPAEPTLSALAFITGNPALWPAGFVWDFRFTAHCAIGLAALTWPQAFPDGPCFDRAQELFDLNDAWAEHLFAPGYVLTMTHEQVAARIARYAEWVG